jgi:two-component system LytT family response regulator
MLRSIIIDDEPNSRETLELMLKKHGAEIILLDSCSNPLEGIESIAGNNPDLVFLDIEMPGMSGFEMLQRVSPVNFDVVFTTAYDQYAINAIRFSALDYLLKPVDADDLAAVIRRCKEKKEAGNLSMQLQVLFNKLDSRNSVTPTIALPAIDGLLFIKTADIIRCEASSSYTRFFLQNKETILVSRTLKEFEEMLPSNFFRVHDSHIINIDYLKKYIRGDGGQALLADGSCIDVSRRRKNDFLQKISAL